MESFLRTLKIQNRTRLVNTKCIHYYQPMLSTKHCREWISLHGWSVIGPTRNYEWRHCGQRQHKYEQRKWKKQDYDEIKNNNHKTPIEIAHLWSTTTKYKISTTFCCKINTWGVQKKDISSSVFLTNSTSKIGK